MLVDVAVAPLEIKTGTDIKAMNQPIQRTYSFLNLLSLVAVIGWSHWLCSKLSNPKCGSQLQVGYVPNLYW